MKPPRSWERQPYESDPQWIAFTYFRDMPAPRSVDGAYRRFFIDKNRLQTGDESVSKKRAPGGWQNWSRAQKWDGTAEIGALTWEQRATEYETYLDQQVQEQYERDLVSKRRKLTRDELADSEMLLDKWHRLIERTALHDQQRTTRKPKPGEDAKGEIEVTTVALSVRDWILLTQLRKLVSDLARRALGMPINTSESKVDHTSDGKALTALTADAWASIHERVRRELDAWEAEHGNGDPD